MISDPAPARRLIRAVKAIIAAAPQSFLSAWEFDISDRHGKEIDGEALYRELKAAYEAYRKEYGVR